MGTLSDIGNLLIQLDTLPETVEKQRRTIDDLKSQVSSQELLIKKLEERVNQLENVSTENNSPSYQPEQICGYRPDNSEKIKCEQISIVSDRDPKSFHAEQQGSAKSSSRSIRNVNDELSRITNPTGTVYLLSAETKGNDRAISLFHDELRRGIAEGEQLDRALEESRQKSRESLRSFANKLDEFFDDFADGTTETIPEFIPSGNILECDYVTIAGTERSTSQVVDNSNNHQKNKRDNNGQFVEPFVKKKKKNKKKKRPRGFSSI